MPTTVFNAAATVSPIPLCIGYPPVEIEPFAGQFFLRVVLSGI
jgi:hypothetical protein